MAAKKAKPTQERPSAGRKKKNAPAAKKETPRRAALTPAQVKAKNQRCALLLFVLAVFFGCLVLIPGESLWRLGHNFALGLFGIWAILWPVLLLYIAVVLALEKTVANFRSRMLLVSAIILLVCAVGCVFSSSPPAEEMSFWEKLGYDFAAGVNRGTNSLMGGLLGIPMLAMFGGIGAKIILLLVLFVAVMVLTGTTLLQLFRAFAKPVNAVSRGVRAAKVHLDERSERERARRQAPPPEGDIDIAIDGETVSAARQEARSLFPKTNETEHRQPADDEKRRRLLNAFDAQEAAPEVAQEDAPPAAEAAQEQPEDASSAAAADQPPQEAETAREPKDAAADETEADAARAVEEFMRNKEAGDRRESNVPHQKPAAEIHYTFPPVSMLEASAALDDRMEAEELQTSGKMLVDTLKSFGVQTSIVNISRGPSVTRYELQPAMGVKISKITGLADDIAMNLAAVGVRIEAPIPGKAAVGIEVPNKTRATVRMRELIESNSFVTAKSKLTVALGRDIAGQVQVADLSKMPHLLIAGTTGSGKSVCINSMIISLLYKASPDDVRLLMIDPKVVELGIYNDIPHLLTPVVTDPRKAAGALGWAVNEMLGRYRTFAECNVRDIAGYNSYVKASYGHNENGQEMKKMAQIVIIIDELSDLMMAAPNDVEDSICRLAQMARAAGMYLIVATQRPSVDVVTGLIKANIPSRIAFAVSSVVDSRTILDTGGAEKLLGRGDMLFAPIGAQKPVRIQGCFVTDSEIESIINFVKAQHESAYDTKVIEEIERNAVESSEDEDSGDTDGFSDDRMEEAIQCVIEAGQASTSLLQRRLRLGYARAGRLIDEMEQMGIVGPHEGSKPRQVLMTYQQWLERKALKQEQQ